MFFIPEISFQSLLGRVEEALFSFLPASAFVLPKSITKEVRPALKGGHVVAAIRGNSEKPILGNTLEGTRNHLKAPAFTI